MSEMKEKAWVVLFPDETVYCDGDGYPYMYAKESSAKSAISRNWDLGRGNPKEKEKFKAVLVEITYDFGDDDEEVKEKTGLKRFACHVESESGDDYYFQFEYAEMPHTDQQWIEILGNQEELAEEMSHAFNCQFDGPGQAGTYLRVKSCSELLGDVNE